MARRKRKLKPIKLQRIQGELTVKDGAHSGETLPIHILLTDITEKTVQVFCGHHLSVGKAAELKIKNPHPLNAQVTILEIARVASPSFLVTSVPFRFRITLEIAALDDKLKNQISVYSGKLDEKTAA